MLEHNIHIESKSDKLELLRKLVVYVLFSPCSCVFGMGCLVAELVPTLGD